MVRNGILCLACYHYWITSIKPILLFTWCFKPRGLLSAHVNVIVDSTSLVSERFECQYSPVLAASLRVHSISRKAIV